VSLSLCAPLFGGVVSLPSSSPLSSYGSGAPTIHLTSSGSSAWGWVLHCRMLVVLVPASWSPLVVSSRLPLPPLASCFPSPFPPRFPPPPPHCLVFPLVPPRPPLLFGSPPLVVCSPPLIPSPHSPSPPRAPPVISVISTISHPPHEQLLMAVVGAGAVVVISVLSPPPCLPPPCLLSLLLLAMSMMVLVAVRATLQSTRLQTICERAVKVFSHIFKDRNFQHTITAPQRLATLVNVAVSAPQHSQLELTL
jgi:hypothetical protein